MTIDKCAAHYSIQRDPMRTILLRRGAIMRPRPRGTTSHLYRGGGVMDERAFKAVYKAIKKGILKRGPCEQCGTTVAVYGHHDDYNKQLEVRWLCQKHHHEWHRHNKAVPVCPKPPPPA